MAPTSAMLQGLNIVQHPPQQSFADQNDLTDEPLSQDLLSQLERWSSVNFATDEPLPTVHDRDSVDCLDNACETPESPSNAQQQPSTLIDQSPPPSSLFSNYDSYLSGFPASADAFPVPSTFGNMFFSPSDSPSPASGHDNNSLIVHPSLDLGHFTHTGTTLDSLNGSSAHDHEQQQKRLATSGQYRTAAGSDLPVPAAKKSRTSTTGTATSRAISTATPASQAHSGSADADHTDEHESQSPPAHHTASGTKGKNDISTPITASEDKRRRNTAASARFRLKKKEREQAMERRAKELESRVGELERECEALRRENGWLKGLVVGVTGSVPGTAPADAVGMTGSVPPQQLSPPPAPVPSVTETGSSVRAC